MGESKIDISEVNLRFFLICKSKWKPLQIPLSLASSTSFSIVRTLFLFLDLSNCKILNCFLLISTLRSNFFGFPFLCSNISNMESFAPSLESPESMSLQSRNKSLGSYELHNIVLPKLLPKLCNFIKSLLFNSVSLTPFSKVIKHENSLKIQTLYYPEYLPSNLPTHYTIEVK